ncbi:MAG: hypothetical protein NTV51_02210, partial [Verrucomicrobia bacterium]|nr:hypothetical protein [Verrucomicrobiota bacterium]
HQIETHLTEDDSGFLTLRPAYEESCAEMLPARLHRPLHFVLTTEVCCAPPGAPKSARLHHLILFRTIDSARRFQSRVAPFGDLRQGRPALALTSRQLLALVVAHGDDTELAPAHVLSPHDSALGSVAGHRSLGEVFGEFTSRILAVEMGCTSTPAMCRRLGTLDEHTLFCSSDAHSLGNIGREYTLMEIAPSYTALIDALRTPGDPRVRGFVKFPVEFTGAYLNGCENCGFTFDGVTCPACRVPLVQGSRDRTAALADRPESVSVPAPIVRELFPLAHLLAGLADLRLNTKPVRHRHRDLLHELGDERYILTGAPLAAIAQVHTRQLARVIESQRKQPPRCIAGKIRINAEQLALDF